MYEISLKYGLTDNLLATSLDQLGRGARDVASGSGWGTMVTGHPLMDGMSPNGKITPSVPSSEHDGQTRHTEDPYIKESTGHRYSSMWKTGPRKSENITDTVQPNDEHTICARCGDYWLSLKHIDR